MGNMTDVNDFLKDYLGDPLEDYTKEQIMDAIQEYLIDKGYGREQTIAAISFNRLSLYI